MWTRWRCSRCYTNIPAGLCGKYRQAVAARTGEWSTGSSTSSGEENRKDKSLEDEANWSIIESGVEKKPGEGKTSHPGEKVTWRKIGDWTLRIRSRAEKVEIA